jgi:hypothetical protein
MEQANLRPETAPVESEVSGEEKRLIATEPAPPVGEALPKPKPIGLSQLVNKINYLNFFDKSLYVIFRHNQYQRELSLKAKPNPCQDNQLTCHWQNDAEIIVVHPDAFCFEKILIPDGKRFIVAEPEVLEIDGQTIRLLLPDVCSAEDARRTRRDPCRDTHVYITQNGALFYGVMIDFCAYSFRVRVQTAPPQTFDWVESDLPVNLIVFDGNRTLYSGECRIVKQTHGHTRQDWVLSAVHTNIRRFRPKEFRSARHQMIPLPTVRFVHPLTKRHVNLEVQDISGSGMAIREESKYAVLLPGLIIPDLQICFGNGDHVSCIAQVIYSQPGGSEDNPTVLRCGVAILDMDADEHRKLLALIQQTGNKNAYLCNQVHLEDLWSFFFETGFIYPAKYEYIEKHKVQIKSVYSKLYTENPAIARHFIHQRNGLILAHMSIVRFYEKAWLMHHLAAIRSSDNRGGLAVFKQIGSFINDSHRLNSINMNYAFCYYRPENKFPNHVFSGAAKHIQNPKRCSVDQFAYFHLVKHRHRQRPLPPGWELKPVSDHDLRDLESYYEECCGGLMIQALDLGIANHDIADTEAAFAQIGLVRSRHLYSLKMTGQLKAVLMIDIADIGLNMSDLTNSVKMIILDQTALNWPIIQSGILNLFDRFQIDEMPILAHPADSVTSLGLPNEKNYNLWIFDLNYTDEYFRYLKRLFKFLKH